MINYPFTSMQDTVELNPTQSAQVTLGHVTVDWAFGWDNDATIAIDIISPPGVTNPTGSGDWTAIGAGRIGGGWIDWNDNPIVLSYGNGGVAFLLVK